MSKSMSLLKRGIIVLFSFLCMSCSMFNEPVKEFFKEYTETAAIEIENLPDYRVYDSRSLNSFSSDQDLVITYLLRNPQKYSLNFNYKFPDGMVNPPVMTPGSEELKFVQSSDKNSVVLRIAKSYLNKIDKENLENKDISGQITIYEPKSGRYFKSFQTELSANTVPPEITDAKVMILTDASGAQSYVLCFNFPKLAGTVHEKDINKLYFKYPQKNGSKFVEQLKVLEIESCAIKSDAEVTVSSTAPAGTLSPSSGGNFTADTTNCIPYYYSTGIALTPENLIYSLNLTDDYGLSTETVIGNNSPKLFAPSITDSKGLTVADNSDHVFTVDEDTGVASIFIKESGRAAYYKNESGALVVERETSVTGAALSWTVYDASSSPATVYSSGKSTGSVELKLPKGKYTINASQSKPYYVSSDSVKTKDGAVVMKIAPKYYVSKSGKDTNTGKRNSPFATIQKAIDEIEANEDAGTGITAADNPAGEIYLMSDIEIPGQITFKSSSSTQTKSYVLGGYGGKRRITRASGYNATQSIIYFESNVTANRAITLQNLIISGENLDSADKTLIYFDSHGTDSKFSIINCTFANNTVKPRYPADGAVIYAKVNTVIKDCDISGNILDLSNKTVAGDVSSKSSIIYCEYALELSNVTIKDNVLKKGTFANNVTCNGAVSANGDCKISGKNTITGNYYDSGASKEYGNLYIPAGNTLTVSGSLSGSRIGIITADTPAPATPVTFTSDFGTYNSSVKSSAVFTSDKGYYTGSSATEAGLYVSSGTITPSGYDKIGIQCLTSKVMNPAAANTSGRTIVFNAYNNSTGEDVTSRAAFTYTVKYLGSELPSAYWRATGNKIVLSENTGYGIYNIQVTAVIDGKKYGSTHDVEVCQMAKVSDLNGIAPTASAASPVTLSVASQADLKQVSDWTRAKNKLKDVTLVLEKDIECSEYQSIGAMSSSEIADSNNLFCGILDGNGHVIKINSFSSKDDNSKALIAGTGEGSEIKNLILEGDINSSDKNYVCGFVICPRGKITISNCINRMNITGTGQYIAGFTLTGQTNELVIENCRNEGNISGKGNISGFGTLNVVGGTIRNCVNTGKISGTSGNVAGFYHSASIDIYNCINRGEISGSTIVGGISGNASYNTNSSKGIIENCLNLGSISCTNGIAGGIVGELGGNSGNFKAGQIKNCVNLGTVTCSNPAVTSVGSIVGKIKTNNIYTIKNNFYLKQNDLPAIGDTDNTDTSVFGMTAFTQTVSGCTTGTQDVVELLNEWITSGSGGNDVYFKTYSKWVYKKDASGKAYPYLSEVE